jgi:hypothetical protein
MFTYDMALTDTGFSQNQQTPRLVLYWMPGNAKCRRRPRLLQYELSEIAAAQILHFSRRHGSSAFEVNVS